MTGGTDDTSRNAGNSTTRDASRDQNKSFKVDGEGERKQGNCLDMGAWVLG
jgi:hypothetical protein